MHGHGPCMIVTHQYMQYKSSNQDWFSTISKYVAEPSATLSALPKFSQPPFACTSPYPESSGLPARVRNPEEGPEAKLISSPGQRGQRQKRKKERKKERKRKRKRKRTWLVTHAPLTGTPPSQGRGHQHTHPQERKEKRKT